MYLHTLTLFYKQEEYSFNLKSWSKDGKKFLINTFLKLNDIDWNIESVLPLVCDTAMVVVKFFIGRIKLKEKLDSKRDHFDYKAERYDAVPYHMNDELIDFVTKDKDFDKVCEFVLQSLPIKYSVESIEMSQLIRHFKINYRSLLKNLKPNAKLNKNIVNKISLSLPDTERNDIDFLIDLAGYTDDKNIHDRLYGKLSSTGVVSGQFGIADAYKIKIEQVKKHENSKNKNIKAFVEMSIKYLTHSESNARISAAKEQEMRRIDFEANN